LPVRIKFVLKGNFTAAAEEAVCGTGHEGLPVNFPQSNSAAGETNSLTRANGHFGLRRLLVLAADAIVVLYIVLDGIVAPVFGPLLRLVARLRFVLRLQDAVAALPPYAILVLVAVPMLIAEPAKLYALWLLSRGLFWAGIATITTAYVLSLVIAERIYHAGRTKLRTIAWFARLMDWLTSIRDYILAFLRASWIWAYAAKLKLRSKAMAARFRLYFHIG
jgi:hypothetical protein